MQSHNREFCEARISLLAGDESQTFFFNEVDSRNMALGLEAARGLGRQPGIGVAIWS